MYLCLQVLKWADELRTLKVKANADTPEDAQRARQLGAEGIGTAQLKRAPVSTCISLTRLVLLDQVYAAPSTCSSTPSAST